MWAMQKMILRILMVSLLIVPLLLSAAPVKAQGISASELIQAVNELRASYDLAPYQMDEYWMRVAQDHSEYMASINSITHTREDGTEPADHQISSENVGGGYAVTAPILINQWSDYWHSFTLIGFSNGLVGAGVAEGENGYLYYTLVVKNTGELTGLPDTNPGESAPFSQAETQEITGTIEPLVTATPQEDGSIMHQVAIGETLWDIAISYDVIISELAAMNNLDQENPLIYPGQSLLVRPAYTPTATTTITNTSLPPTRTLRPSRTPQPSRPSETPVPPGAAAEAPLMPEDPLINRQNMNTLGIVTIIIAVLGAAALLFGRIWIKKGS